jgi:transcriptional activator for dhaKLM operon
MTGESPHQSWPNYNELLKNWQTYIDHHRIEPGVDMHIARSWQRCYPRLNPMRELEPTQLSTGFLNAIDSNAGIRIVGRRTLEDVYEFMEGSGSALLLVNSTGYILEMLGDPEMMGDLGALGIRRGILFDESHMGTNAFALAATDGIPIRVRGPEHFLMQHHALADAAAPLFDINGRPLGAIGIINHFEKHYPHTLSLAVTMAQTVLSQRGMDVLLAEQNNQLAQMNAVLGVVTEGIMIWNPEGRLLHINEAAEKILNVARNTILGKRYQDFLSLPPWLEEAIREREPLDNVNVGVHFGNHPLALTISLSFLQSKSESHSIIVTLRKVANPPQDGEQISNRYATSLNERLPGNSIAIRRARSLARTAATARAGVMIRGERGTGKNTLAAAIHNNGPHREEPFVTFSCAFIPPDQMLAELLGPQRDGLEQESWGEPGKLEMAQGGTIYFQDVDRLVPEAQAVLLDALELGVVRYPDHHHPISLDVRVIASSSADMQKLIRDGEFRSDLYYRLSVFEISLPPLRERPDDLPELIERMLKHTSLQFNGPLGLTREALEILMEYDWPRNLHELAAVLQLAASQVNGQTDISPSHLPDFVFHPSHEEAALLLPRISSLQEIQREAVIQSARQTRGNVTQMAQKLGISRTTVWRKLREFEIMVDDFREAKV